MGERAEWTGGEDSGDGVGTIRVRGQKVVVVFGMVFEGSVQESSVAEGAKVKEELSGGGVSQGMFGVMKILVVLGDPSGGEEAMFGGDVMTEGVSKVPGGV